MAYFIVCFSSFFYKQSKPNKAAHVFRCISQRFETKQSGTCISLHQSTFRNQTNRHMHFAASVNVSKPNNAAHVFRCIRSHSIIIVICTAFCIVYVSVSGFKCPMHPSLEMRLKYSTN